MKIGLQLCLIVGVVLGGSFARADDVDVQTFGQLVQPVLRQYCVTCHSTEKQKGDLDLERFTSLDQVRGAPLVWERALEQIRDNEMPPEGKPKPSPEQLKGLTDWMQSTLDEIALANAGDPGPVVLRRLSNMEYTYSIRDLTGVQSLDPAKEFPVDGAAGEGFTNAGAALVMSPSLLTKYLDAAKDIASHAVLTPQGIRFSPHDSPRDWTDEMLSRIRDFYARFTATGNGTAVDSHGVKFETNGGGIAPLEKYIASTRDGKDSPNLSAKYLNTLRAALEDKTPSLILDGVRERWRSGASAADIVSVITQWQRALWRFTTIGHIGKLNGPKSWQEPVLPLTTSAELRVKLPEGSGTTVYLSTFNIVPANVLWEDARLVTPSKPDRSLAISGSELQVSGDIGKDSELVINVRLQPGSQGAVQARLLTTQPSASALVPSNYIQSKKKSSWSAGENPLSFDAPILVGDDSETRKLITAQFSEFRSLFPLALCYTRIVPVDEVVTLTLFHREDDHLKRLMLNEAQIAEIDRLWDELHFVSESPLQQVDVFEQLWQFATQDADPAAFEPLRAPILRSAEDFKKRLIEVEPKHVKAVFDFAKQAWRRPLSDAEQDDLSGLYQELRQQELPHAAAVRMLLARVLVAPAFLYRGESAVPGLKASPVNDWALATRLSYFLWSSVPDDELRFVAASGTLHGSEVLVGQARRMMKDARIRRLATEFGCQWLHVRDVETLDEKSERHFPTFASLRGAMQEEAVRFFTDLFQENRSVMLLLDADYSFVNGALARHYALDLNGDEWQRVDGLRSRGRGGVLGFASTLAKQSGASRTSPILRGNWLSEVILGEKLPRPPKGVPPLPEEAPQGLTERQLIERHSSDAKCSGCHRRMDPFGFALESFDAIGRARRKDAAGLAIDTRTSLPDGTVFEGLDGLRSYLVSARSDDFLRQFSRKLLGYALGRSVQLSDKPLIASIVTQLRANDNSVATAIEVIVRSPQFRELRGKDFAAIGNN